MSRLQSMRAAYSRYIADDNPLWTDVVGALLAFGLVTRTGIHIWTVLIANERRRQHVEPDLQTSDVTLQSPVADLNGRRLDVLARYLTFVMGLGWWVLLDPLHATRPSNVQLFLVANLAVCIGDPLLLVLDRVSSRVRTG